MIETKLIGLSGYAKTGKDLFCEKLIEYLGEQEQPQKASRIAFADRLKKDLNHFTSKHMGLSALTKAPEEKTILRPLFVAYGEGMRTIDPQYWVKKIEHTANSLLGLGVIPIVTDVRYENEAIWTNQNGILIFLKRDGVVAPNRQEMENTPLVKNKANIIVDWPTTSNDSILNEIVEATVHKIKGIHNAKR